MNVHEAAEILLKAVHDDLNGTIVFSHFLAHQTEGYDERTSAEIIGLYNKALLVLIDEGLAHRGPKPDVIELGQKGVDSNGNYKKFLKKKHTANFLERARRIFPILTFALALIGFCITYLHKTNNDRKMKARTQMKKDSIMHAQHKK
jgi:hypothetical protein